MFRITISDKFGHVLSRLQKIVTDETKSSAAMLPKHINLEEVNKKVTPELKRKIDSVYYEKELTVVVVFQIEENNDITLLGVTKRSWELPTLAFEEAIQNGLTYKCFTLPMAHATNPNARLKEKFDNICEILHISITNLQMRTKTDYEEPGSPEFLWH